MPILGAIMSFLTGWFARFIGVQAVRFFALKALLWFLMMTIFPVVLYNIMAGVIGDVMSAVNTVGSGYSQSNGILVQLTGFAGWLAIVLKVPEVFALIISASGFRMAINMIPFAGKM